MTKACLRIFTHHSPRKYGALVRAHVVPFSPPPADILIEIGAGINLIIIRVEVIENLRCGVYTLGGLTNRGCHRTRRNAFRWSV